MRSNPVAEVFVVIALSCGIALGQSGSAVLPPANPQQAVDAAKDEFRYRGPDLVAQSLRGLRPDVAMAILSAQPGGEISLEALATPLLARTNSVAVFVEIDGVSFLRAARGPIARVDLYGYALTPDGGVAAHFAKAFAVDLSVQGERLWTGGFRFVTHLDLPPSTFELRILVREHTSGASGLRILALDTASNEAAGPQLGIPLLPPPPGQDGWLTVQGSVRTETTFQHADRTILPAALPIIMSSRTLRGYLPARDLPPAATPGSLVFTPKNGVATRIPVVLQPPLGVQSGSLGVREFHLEMPHLGAGEYSLHAELQSSGMLLAGPALGVVVVGESPRNRDLVWSDLRDVSSAGNVRAAALAQPGGRPGKRKQRAEAVKRAAQITRRYATVLESWSTDRSAIAKADLLTLESAVLRPGSGVSFDELHSAEMSAVGKLASHDPECLVPILLLHREIYLTYRQRHLFSLTAHARAMIEEVIELYTERTSSPGARQISADALTDLGGLLLDANLLTASRRLFRESLELAPGRQTPQIALVTSHERYGEFADALEILESLHTSHPKFGEAALRLAVNLGRVGRKGRSEVLLVALDSPEYDGWVRSLARQELARLSFEKGDLESASRLLEAVEEDERSLSDTVLLAHLYDRVGRHRRSLELLREVRMSKSSDQSSARKTYDSWPEELLAEAERHLVEAAAVRMSTLAAGIAARWPS